MAKLKQLAKALKTIIILSIIMIGCNAPSSNDNKEKERLNNEIELLKKEIELLKNNSSNKKIDESSDYKKEEAKGGGSSEGAVDKTVYYGFYFSVNIPPNFTVSKSGGNEVYLISQDETIEFFVFSPLWSGNPETYLKMAPTEELEYEKTTEVKEGERPNQYGDDITRWVTFKAKDGSYVRSFVSIKRQVGRSDTHHVFGIKYKDKASYEKYKETYLAFKKSLEQFAD